METQTAVLTKLYTCLAKHDHPGMAECYHQDAHFQDIGFTLDGVKQIQAMWHLISETDLRCTFKIVEGEGSPCTVDLVDEYTFPPTRRPVRNEIRSVFKFKDGRIIDHRDSCDARKWCLQAWGPILGVPFWLLPFLRRFVTMLKFRSFVRAHREYATV